VQRILDQTQERARELVGRTPLTPTGFAVACMVGGVGAVGYTTQARALLLLTYGAAITIGAAALLMSRPGRSTTARCPLPSRITAGEPVEVSFADTRLGTGAVLVERLPVALGSDRVLGPDDDNPSTRRYRIGVPPRGAWTIGPTEEIRTDPAGVLVRSTAVCEPVELLVHPRIEPVEGRTIARLLEDPPIRPPRPQPWRTGMEFAGARPYSPGDDVRRIMWRAYARTDDLVVKESERGLTDRVAVVIDTEEAHYPAPTGDGTIEAFERAVSAAASLAVQHLTDGFRVDLWAGDVRVGPLRGISCTVPILDGLARTAPGSGTVVDHLLSVRASSAAETHVVLVAPTIRDPALHLVEGLVGSGRSVLVIGVATTDDDVEALARTPVTGAQLVDLRPGERLVAALARRLGAAA
jgi:uncharacterized protein (DUF58 family)